MADSARDIKVIVIGPSGAGKTCMCLFKHLIKSKYRSNREENNVWSSRIGNVYPNGANYCHKDVLWNDSELLRIQLWDLAGQDRFVGVSRGFYKDAEGCILVFDSSDKHSLQGALKWKQTVDDYFANKSPIPAVLFANKVDLQQNEWATAQLLSEFCTDNNLEGWFETSALDPENSGISSGLKSLIHKILEANVPFDRFSEDTLDLEKSNDEPPGCHC